jgi:hypothetical protein
MFRSIMATGEAALGGEYDAGQEWDTQRCVDLQTELLSVVRQRVCDNLKVQNHQHAESGIVKSRIDPTPRSTSELLPTGSWEELVKTKIVKTR